MPLFFLEENTMKRMLIGLMVLMTCMILNCREENSSPSIPTTPHWSSSPQRPWTAITPAGIRLVTDQSTIEQYEERWGGNFHWEQIDWEILDKEFEYQKQYYCYTLNWDCKEVTPSHLTVYIKPWDGRCIDEESPNQPKEIYEYINGQWNCIDGWYSKQTIYLHLGDDPGIDHTVIFSEEPPSSIDYRAFQESAYSHELMHFFQEMSGRPFSEYDPPAGTIRTLIIGYTIILPTDQEEETEKEIEE